jgi:hypothetical protein
MKKIQKQSRMINVNNGSEGEIGLEWRRELTKVSEGDTMPGALSWPALAAQTESSPDPLPLPDPQVSCS